jgi:hypothetical protein
LTAPQTLSLARRLNVALVPFGAGLRAVGTRDAITELAPHITACKPELLHLLTEPRLDPPTPKPHTPTRQTFGESVETWQLLARAYQLHHFTCPTCIASGKGYGLRCSAGASLWRAYSEAD